MKIIQNTFSEGPAFSSLCNIFIIYTDKQVNINYEIFFHTQITNINSPTIAYLFLIPSTEKTEEMQRHKTPPPSLPLQESLVSISSFLYTYWLFSNLYAGTTFSINFNSWINKFSQSVEESKLERYSAVLRYRYTH